MAENREVRAILNVSTFESASCYLCQRFDFLVKAVLLMECGGHDQSAAPRKVELHELVESFDPFVKDAHIATRLVIVRPLLNALSSN
jgi:hypothetical protein